MSKKQTEINPVPADRVKTILNREGITQSRLAELIFQTQQNVSRIMNKKQTLTEETARSIIAVFPAYRLQWLLGYDEYMTQNDELRAAIHSKVDSAEALNQLIQTLTDEICTRENIPRQSIPFLPDFSGLQSLIREYSEMVIYDYLKNRIHSRTWQRIDSEYQSLKQTEK